MREKKKSVDAILWKQYAQGKQTYEQIAEKHKRSRRWVQSHIDSVQVQKKECEIGEVVLVVDTTYFKRTFGVMVFRCPHRKKNLLWKFVPYETIAAYISGVQELQTQGWKILGIVCDARRGLVQAFPEIPVQMCQFHQVQIILRYITQNPKLEAGKELKELILTLAETDEASFCYWLNLWHAKWQEFLAEKTIDPMTHRWHFTHKRLRSAYRSIASNLPWLFTSERYQSLNIPNTTNSLEGFFAHIKKKIHVHPGLTIARKQKLISELLS